MRVSIREAQQLLNVPLPVLLHLLLDLIELFLILLLNFLLKRLVEDWNEELIEMSAAERARHSHPRDLLRAVHAHNVLARKSTWLHAESEAYWALHLIVQTRHCLLVHTWCRECWLLGSDCRFLSCWLGFSFCGFAGFDHYLFNI